MDALLAILCASALVACCWTGSGCRPAAAPVGPDQKKKKRVAYLDPVGTSRPSLGRLRFAKWANYAMDSAYLLASLVAVDAAVAAHSFGPRVATLAWLFPALCMVCDVIKGRLLFGDILPPVKTQHMQQLGLQLTNLVQGRGGEDLRACGGRLLRGEGWLRHWADTREVRNGVLYHLLYLLKAAVYGVATHWMAARMGLATWEPLGTSVGQWGPFTATQASVVYLEYLLMTFLGDFTGLHILHELMHRRFYSLHKTHHMPMRELSMLNGVIFDWADLAIETNSGPVMLLMMKALLGFALGRPSQPSFHLAAYMMHFAGLVNAHSCSPFTVCFWNPLLETIVKVVVSHNLHHAKNRDHFSFFPLHQLRLGGLDRDVAEYNAIFGTSIALHGDKVPVLMDVSPRSMDTSSEPELSKQATPCRSARPARA